MPNQPLTPCRHPGCGQLLPTPGYCTLHRHLTCKTVYDQTTRRDDPRRALSASLRNTSRYRRFRDWFNDHHPLCCDPFNEHGDMPVASANVHHVIPIYERPDLLLDELNCRPLCTACHARIERMERNGDSTAGLFAVMTNDF